MSIHSTTENSETEKFSTRLWTQMSPKKKMMEEIKMLSVRAGLTRQVTEAEN